MSLPIVFVSYINPAAAVLDQLDTSCDMVPERGRRVSLHWLGEHNSPRRRGFKLRQL